MVCVTRARRTSEEAGELGKPFTQLANFGDGEKGNQEEWVGWLDWDELAGGAAGGSGSGA